MSKLFESVILLLAALMLTGSANAESYGLAYQPSLGAATAAVADHLGLFSDEGLSLKMRVFNDGTLINEALAANAAQFGLLGDLPTITAVSSLPVKIVATVGGGGARERLMVSDANIAGFLDLKGAKIGLTRGTSGFNAFQLVCITHKLSMSDFQIVNMRPADMPEALASGQVEAVLSWEPTPSIIEANGLGHELLNLKDAEMIFPMTLVVRTSVLENDPETVKKVLRALNKAAQYIQNNPEGASKIIAKVTGLAPELAQRSLGFHYYKVSWDQQVEHSLKLAAEMLFAEKQLRQLPRWEQVIDSRLCTELGL